VESKREVLMGYQYALHQHKKQLLQEKVWRGEVANLPAQQTGYSEKNATTRHSQVKEDTAS
jgi:hypothetical protein